MNARQRILAAWDGRPADHVPLSAWCFGWQAPPHLCWHRAGSEVRHWYSMRMEHIHTLPQAWTLDDDFSRFLAWDSLGVDDVLDISVPWSADPEVTVEDRCLPPSAGVPNPILARRYHTPSGTVRHEVRQTGEVPGPGWVVQPDHVPLFEDFNIPRGVRHAVSSAADVGAIAHLYCPPNERTRADFGQRLDRVRSFAGQYGAPVQAWSAFGMDGVVWLTGVEGAIMMAMDEPAAFGRLVDLVAHTDLARTELALSVPGVDMIVERGWYSSTELWSPRLFDRFVLPHVRELAALAHRRGARFGYVMTTGVARLGPRLADAGVDLLYFADPLQDALSLEWARDVLADRMTLAGGINALTLASDDPARIDEAVRRALDVLAPTNRFILQPVDALFPDTPWAGVQRLIEAWRQWGISTRGPSRNP